MDKTFIFVLQANAWHQIYEVCDTIEAMTAFGRNITKKISDVTLERIIALLMPLSSIKFATTIFLILSNRN